MKVINQTLPNSWNSSQLPPSFPFNSSLPVSWLTHDEDIACDIEKWRRHLFSQLRKRNFFIFLLQLNDAFHTRQSRCCSRSSLNEAGWQLWNVLCVKKCFSTFLFFDQLVPIKALKIHCQIYGEKLCEMKKRRNKKRKTSFVGHSVIKVFLTYLEIPYRQFALSNDFASKSSNSCATRQKSLSLKWHFGRCLSRNFFHFFAFFHFFKSLLKIPVGH